MTKAALEAIIDRADNGDLGTSKVQDMRAIAVAALAAAPAESSQGLPPGFRAQAALAVFAAKSGTEHASTSDVSTAYRAAQAVRAADALIAELAKKPQK